VSFAGIAAGDYSFSVAPQVTASGGGAVDFGTRRAGGKQTNSKQQTMDVVDVSSGSKITTASVTAPPNTMPDDIKEVKVKQIAITKDARTPASASVSQLTQAGDEFFFDPTGTTFVGTVKICLQFDTKYADTSKLTGDERRGVLVVAKKSTAGENQNKWVTVPQVPEVDLANKRVCVQVSSFSSYSANLAIPSTATPPASPGGTVAPSPPGQGGSPGTIIFARASSSASVPAIAMLLALAALLAALL
jgi:hypothetical protein